MKSMIGRVPPRDKARKMVQQHRDLESTMRNVDQILMLCTLDSDRHYWEKVKGIISALKGKESGIGFMLDS